MDLKTDLLFFETSVERDDIRKFIGDIQNERPNSPCFLNLYAPKGFGRSALLKLIWEENERKLPLSLVRIDDFCDKNESSFDMVGLLRQVIGDLALRLPSRNVSLPADYEAWTDRQALAALLVSVVDNAAEYDKVTLLLIDDYDSSCLPDDSRRWFQDNVFNKALRTNRFGTILTSETQIRFRENFELRLRLKSRNLQSLDTEGISLALPPEFGDISGEIYRVTGGLPALTQEFVRELEVSEVRTPTDYRAQAQELTSKYYRGYVTKTFLNNFDSEETLLVLALLRWFDVRVMKQMLPELLPDIYRNYDTPEYLELIERLSPWIEWRSQKGGYTLNPAVRLMVRGYVRAIRPELYQKVNQAAAAMYREWLESKYDQSHLVELLYHSLAFYKLQNGSSSIMADTSSAQVDEILAAYMESDNGQRLGEDDLAGLGDELRKDIDLKDYVSANVEQTIQKLIDDKSRGMPLGG